MKIEYDKVANAAYIYVRDKIKDGEVKKSEKLSNDIIFDYDKNNLLLGIEILSARKNLAKSILSSSIKIGNSKKNKKIKI
tara:strand:- start:417 stop:656 length:240 start_codon:yes stop_codon:yes gene_type:complete